jgi:hypothetical protein
MTHLLRVLPPLFARCHETPRDREAILAIGEKHKPIALTIIPPQMSS